MAVFLLGKTHGQRSLACYSPWGYKELDMTEWMKNNNTLTYLVLQENRHKDPTQRSIRGTSLVVQWLRLHLPMMGLKVWSLSDQCKKIEENNRMGKMRDLFRKIRDTKGTFHANMGSIKDRNGMDLKKQKIWRRDGKITQKNYTNKILMTQITKMVWSLT